MIISGKSKSEDRVRFGADGSDPVVELRGAAKYYGDISVVDGISLEIKEGEFFSLLGPSGCGKTTTLRMIAGFEDPSSGEVRIAGKDVTGVAPYRRPVNTVFQNYALFPHMKVADNVGYPLKMQRVGKRDIAPRVAEALERVDMSAAARRLPHQLSGGQRQRIALARALVGNPRVLLLDEPLGALDLKLREHMQTVLKNLQRDVGITFIYVTHDQGEALAMSDRIAVMNKGVVEQVGSPADIYGSPRTSFVAGFIGKTNLLQARRTAPHVAMVGELKINTRAVLDDTAPTLSLRQEAVLLGPEADSQPNHFSGVITDVVFYGHEQEVGVTVAGQRLASRIGGDRTFEVGESISVGFSLSAPVALDQAQP